MSLTTCQKVTLISCSVLCVSLFLPKMLLSRGKKDAGQQQPEVGPGFYPPIMHRLSPPGDQEQWRDQDPSHTWAHSVEAITKSKGQGRTNSLIGQVLPIYGFGILLYIVYIFYKLTCKGKTSKSEPLYHYTRRPNENVGSNSTDYELARLQQKVLQTESMMNRIISGKGRGSSSLKRKKSKKGQSKKEEKLLKQLSRITHFMQEGRMEGASPEMEAEEVPYAEDWEGYPEETYPIYEEPYESRGYSDVVVLAVPSPRLDTAEALAERMEQEEEEDVECKLEVVQEEEEEEEREEEEEVVQEEEEREEEEEEEERQEEERQEEEREEMEEEKEEEEEEYEEEEEEEGEEEEELEEDEDQPEEERRLLPSPRPDRHATERHEERLGMDVSQALQRVSPNVGKKQISFSEHNDVYHYPKEAAYEEDKEEEEDEEEDEEEEGEVEEEEAEEEEEQGNQMMNDVDREERVDEEDPVTEAERLSFDWDMGFNPEADAEEGNEEYLFVSLPVEGNSAALSDPTKEPGRSGLRMRNRRDIRDS